MSGNFFTVLMLLLILASLGGGLIIAIRLFRDGNRKAAGAVLLGTIFAVVVFGSLSSMRLVGERVGIITKHAMGPSLSNNSIIATNGEMGPQARVLRQGVHFGYTPFLYSVEYANFVTVGSGEVGVIRTNDGIPLPENEGGFAPEWNADTFNDMLDAEFFLTTGQGYRGQQSSVLKPGRYPLNTALFDVEVVPATEVPPSSVAVIKSNVGPAPSDGSTNLVNVGERGIWNQPFPPQVLYINPEAYQAIIVPTTQFVNDFSGSPLDSDDDASESEYMERSIDIKTSDGFEFPIDVRVIYMIRPEDAPLAVSNFYDEKTGSIEGRMHAILNSIVRSEFRNNAERTKAIEFINSRSTQEQHAATNIASDMATYGVTVINVAIGAIDPGRTSTALAELLKTQTDREIAINQIETRKQEALAAIEQQNLNREIETALRMKELVAAEYARLQAAENAAARIEMATADAEAIRLERQAIADGILAEGEATAEAYRLQTAAVGANNLALIQFAERLAQVQPGTITPRILMSNGGSGGGGVFDLITAFYADRYDTTGELPFFGPGNLNGEVAETARPSPNSPSNAQRPGTSR